VADRVDRAASQGGGATFAGDVLEESLAHRLSTEIARYPLGAFASCVLVALAAYVLAVVVVPASPAAFDLWSGGGGRFSAAVAGLAALLCCGVLDRAAVQSFAPSDRALLRLVIALGLTAATLALLCVQRVLLARYLDDPTVTLGVALRNALTDPTRWIGAAAAGFVLAAAATPDRTAGRLARDLVGVRRRRVQVLTGVALLVPVGVALGCVAFVRTMPTAAPSSFTLGAPRLGIGDPLDTAALQSPVPYALVSLACTFVLALPLVFAWYGYAAERLERRLSPLYVGVLLGAATALSSFALTRVAYDHSGMTMSTGIGMGFALVGDVAAAVLAVRLRWLARGGLLPSAVLLATLSTAFYAFAWWPNAVRGRVITGEKAYAWALIGLAVVVAAQAAMWRRGAAGPASAPDPARSPAPPSAYQVVVKDLGMPGPPAAAPERPPQV